MPWFEEPLLDTCWKALLRAPTNVQLHGGVDPVDPLVIPAGTSPTQPIERLPEANPRLLLNEFRERRNDIAVVTLDRKSTRLNSSHVAISYAVFCLKKKTKS